MVTFLVGAVVGVGLTVAVILGAFKVQTKESWEADYLLVDGVHSRADALAAENARLRLSLAAGEMTEDGKKVAALAMAALRAVSSAACKDIPEGRPDPITSQEPACSQEDKQ